MNKKNQEIYKELNAGICIYRVDGSLNFLVIPAKPNQALEDDTELEWHILVIYPPQNRPELHFHPIKVLFYQIMK